MGKENVLIRDRDEEGRPAHHVSFDFSESFIILFALISEHLSDQILGVIPQRTRKQSSIFQILQS